MADKITQCRKNALLSTGPITPRGKAISSKNAIKHGIFAKEVIISKGDGKENEQEFKYLLNNLIASLNPQNQMEHLLVEKIAVDFWRLRRVLRYETGSIRNHSDTATYDFYNKKNWQGERVNLTQEEIQIEIEKLQKKIYSTNRYIESLKKGQVDFNASVWESDETKHVLYLVGEVIKGKMNADEQFLFASGRLSVDQLLETFRRAGYTDQDIAEELIRILEESNKIAERQITELERQKLKNVLAEEVVIKLSSIPMDWEKITRYEKAIQKSILQNLAVLKQLQSSH